MPVEVDPVSIGELSRNFQTLNRSIETAVHRIERKIDERPSMELIRSMEKNHEAVHTEIQGDVKELKDANRWIVRTVFAALLAGVISLGVGVVSAILR